MIRDYLPKVSTIHGLDDGKPYMTRFVWGRYRLHIFWTPDPGRDFHDHPWDFWTFPLRGYYEEAVNRLVLSGGKTYEQYQTHFVPAFKWTFRKAEHLHRIVRPLHPKKFGGIIVTFVITSRERREWGFAKKRFGKWCWQHWREYCTGDKRNDPC